MEAELNHEFAPWLKDMIIDALKSAGKSAAISLCKNFIKNDTICEIGVSAIMAALGL